MFEYNYIIKFHDVDAAGIIFFSNAYKIAHDAYQELMNSFKLEEDFFQNKKYAFPIIHSEADYLKPLQFNDKIIVKANTNRVSNTSYEFNFNFYNTNDEVCVVVKTVHVCVELKSFKKSSLPELLKDKLKELVK